MTTVRVQHAEPVICIGAILVMKCLDSTPCYCCFLIWMLSRILNQVNAQPEYWSRWILMEYYYAYASTQISSKPIYVVWSNSNIHLFCYHEFHLKVGQVILEKPARVRQNLKIHNRKICHFLTEPLLQHTRTRT